MTERHLEDYAAGQRYGSGTLRVDVDGIKAFAAQFDPQPFHLDEAAAAASIFQGFAASGWHTAAMTMRLLVDGELKPAGGIVGAGFEEFRWVLPVRPGDELRVETEILEPFPPIRGHSDGLRRGDPPGGGATAMLAHRRGPPTPRVPAAGHPAGAGPFGAGVRRPPRA